MSELPRDILGLRSRGFYFGKPESSYATTATMIITVVVGVYVLGHGFDGDHSQGASGLGGGEHNVTVGNDADHHRVGTDRPAGEDEHDRRIRERENGRSREAAEPEKQRGVYTSWKSMSDEELKDYYHRHYEGYTRSDLARENRKFYLALRRRGLLDEVPLSPVYVWVTMSNAELIEYYHTHYDGYTRGELRNTNQNFYHELWKRGLLDEVPTSREKYGT